VEPWEVIQANYALLKSMAEAFVHDRWEEDRKRYPHAREDYVDTVAVLDAAMEELGQRREDAGESRVAGQLAKVVVNDATSMEQIADLWLNHIPDVGDEVCLTTHEGPQKQKRDAVYVVQKRQWRIYPQSMNNFGVSLYVTQREERGTTFIVEISDDGETWREYDRFPPGDPRRTLPQLFPLAKHHRIREE
jgi:hypothetical protein